MAPALEALASTFQEETVRVPGAVVDRVSTPKSVEALGELVRAASEDRTGLLLMGGRTRLDLANPASPLGLGVSLTGLSGIDEFDPDEGVLHAAAGTPIQAIRETVAAEGWELPLDSPGRASTVGGSLATAVMGPRAHAFGPVKDAILGLDVVGGDGVATKCGGRVVKNVTGYDLAKLYCGSFGTLAILTGAWLRLRPAPAVRRTFEAPMPAAGAAFEAVRKLGERPSVRAAIWQESAMRPGEARMLLELGGSLAGVEADLAAFREVGRFEEADASSVDHARDAGVTSAQDVARDAGVTSARDVAVRARVLGTNVAEWKDAALAAGLEVSVETGLGVVRASGRLPSAEVLLGLRERAVRHGGFATFERMPEAWRAEVDVFGDVGAGAGIVTALAARFDPNGILNPGRFVAHGAPGGGS
ncbi:MAG: FAD-binding oxidoreductase [bacterium]|nr:FAD-binding oxidoreductase [bacterium]